jgi:5-methylcytosine-specific restriction enzyme A
MAKWPYNTSDWRALRRRKLSENTLCEPCMAAGKLVIATCVDHVIPISSGGPAFPALDGLMSMCDACHNRKSQGEQHGKSFINKGADASGMPVDRNHPFYGQVVPVVSSKGEKNNMLGQKRHGTLTLPALRRRGAGGVK